MFSLTVTETSYAFTFADIAVVTTGEIDLFSDTGNPRCKLSKPTAELQSLEFDPVNEVLFVSDDTNSNVSIYTINLRGDWALEPFIKSENLHYFCIFMSTKFVVWHKNMHTECISFQVQCTNVQTRKCLSPHPLSFSLYFSYAVPFVYYHTLPSSILGHTPTYTV
jgi:hypothetical protein